MAFDVTTDDIHDSAILSNLLDKAERNNKILKVYGDGAFDTADIYELLKRIPIYLRAAASFKYPLNREIIKFGIKRGFSKSS